MKGLIAAAGLSSRLQDLGEKRNKVLFDLGGETILHNLLQLFHLSGITETLVTAGFDAASVRLQCAKQASCLINPFFEKYGILSSLWIARPLFDGNAFLFSVGD